MAERWIRAQNKAKAKAKGRLSTRAASLGPVTAKQQEEILYKELSGAAEELRRGRDDSNLFAEVDVQQAWIDRQFEEMRKQDEVAD